MATMRAIGFHEYGGPKSYPLTRSSDPSLERDSCLCGYGHSGVSQADWKFWRATCGLSARWIYHRFQATTLQEL